MLSLNVRTPVPENNHASHRFYSSVFSPLSGHKIPYLPVKGLAFKEPLNRIGTRDNGLLINSCELPDKWRHSRAYYCPPTLSA